MQHYLCLQYDFTTFLTRRTASPNIVTVTHVAFFGLISEMRDPREFPKSLTMLQVVDTSMYVVTAIVAYRYAGPDVASPALSSAGPVMKKVAYGIAMPTVRLVLALSPIQRPNCFIGRHCWCYLRPRCLQIHLCSRFPWL